MDAVALQIIRTLPGNYRPGAVLSRRESRVVLRATHAASGAPCVLKCLAPPFSAEEGEGFRREFLLLDALRHPCWVRPTRFGLLPGGGLFLEMEESSGVNLSTWPVRGWWPETLAVAHQLLSGLEVLHRLGNGHLDLGPEQLLVDGPGEPTTWDAAGPAPAVRARLLDLGLAAPFGDPVGARGTPGSIAPELLRRDPAWDARADLYSAGTILFELFTGRAPFPGRTVRDVVARQLDGPCPLPGDETGLPPPVCDLLVELLSREAACRPHSALEVWQRLREQAPRTEVGALPDVLVTGTEFAFAGRGEEVARFEAWLATLDPARAEATCVLAGERGIGRRRLAARLATVAESRGWAREVREDHPVARHPSGGEIQIELGPEQAPGSAAGNESAPGRGSAAALAGDVLELELGPMSSPEFEEMLAAAGFESPFLRRWLALASLGSPGLLRGIAAAAPREIDFAARHAGEQRLDSALASLPPPTDWTEWARQLLAALPGVTATALLRAAVRGLPEMPTDFTPESVAEAPGLEAFARRGLLVSDGGGWKVATGAWARAIVGADAARTAPVGRELLAVAARHGGQLARARLGLLLRDPAALRDALPGALSELAGQARREEMLQLFGDAARLGAPSLGGLGPDHLAELLEGIFGLGSRCGAFLPEPVTSSAGRTDPADTGAVARALLDCWAWLGRQQRDRAGAILRSVLQALRERPSRNPPAVGPGAISLPFVATWFRFRLAQASADRAEMDAAAEALVALAPASSPRRQAWSRVARAECLAREGRTVDALRLLERGLDRLPALDEGERGAYLHLVATLRHRLGELVTAAAALDEAEQAFARTGSKVSRLLAAGTIGGVAFQDGNLARAQAWNEFLLREWMARGAWNEAATALVNLALVLVERGRLGESLRALEDAGALAIRTARPLTAQRVAVHRVHTLARSGLLARAGEDARRFLAESAADAPSAALFVRASLGEVLLAEGRLVEGREEYRRAVDGFRGAGADEDAAEILAAWGLAETAGGHRAEARARLRELAPMRAGATGLTLSSILLLQAEAGGDGGDEVVRFDVGSATQAVRMLESQDRWSLAWRAHWCLARACGEANRARDAVPWYGSARTLLTGMVESLATVARTDGFLRLPAVQSFLDELGRA